MTHPDKYLQHPKAIGLKIEACSSLPNSSQTLPLGLIINTQEAFDPGTFVRISHPSLCPETQIHASVLWCRRQDSGYQLALEFRSEEDLYRVRLLEQLCYIKLYQVERQRQGERLSFDSAAEQWIAQYAAHFPADGL